MHRYIASDMDWTLLGENNELTDLVPCSIMDLHKTTSVSLILATGRCRRSAIEKLGKRDLLWSYRCGVLLNVRWSMFQALIGSMKQGFRFKTLKPLCLHSEMRETASWSSHAKETKYMHHKYVR